MILPLLFSFLELAVILGIGYLVYLIVWPHVQLIMIEASLMTQEILERLGL